MTNSEMTNEGRESEHFRHSSFDIHSSLGHFMEVASFVITNGKHSQIADVRMRGAGL